MFFVHDSYEEKHLAAPDATDKIVRRGDENYNPDEVIIEEGEEDEEEGTKRLGRGSCSGRIGSSESRLLVSGQPLLN